MNDQIDNNSTSYPPETALDERDGRYLRKAIVWSHAARRRGNRPFGCVIVAAAGDRLQGMPYSPWRCR